MQPRPLALTRLLVASLCHQSLCVPTRSPVDRLTAARTMFIVEHDKRFPGARMDFARNVTTFIAHELCGQNETVEEKTRKFIVDHFKTVQAAGKLDVLATAD